MSSISFSNYLFKRTKEYKFTIKIACDDLSEEQKNMLETCLTKFNLKDMSEYRETPIQSNPLDFPNVRNTRVYIVDVTVEYPTTPDVMQNYVAEKLGLSRMEIAVYTENDPRHVYTDEWLERMCYDKDEDEEYEPRLSTPENWEEGKYGQEVIDDVMNNHKDKREQRRVDYFYNNLSKEQEIDKDSHVDADPETSTDSVFKKETRVPSRGRPHPIGPEGSDAARDGNKITKKKGI